MIENFMEFHYKVVSKPRLLLMMSGNAMFLPAYLCRTESEMVQDRRASTHQ